MLTEGMYSTAKYDCPFIVIVGLYRYDQSNLSAYTRAIYVTIRVILQQHLQTSVILIYLCTMHAYLLCKGR